MSYIDITCKTCEIDFTVPYKHRDKKYCSRKCYFDDPERATGRKKNEEFYEERICTVCGCSFSVRKKVNKKLCSDTCRKLHNQNTKNERIEKAKAAVLKKHGVTSTLQLSHVREKIKKTNVATYGFEVPTKNDSVKERIKQKLKESDQQVAAQKRKTTKKKKYGDENFNNRTKFKNTIKGLDKKKITEKRENTMIEKYGISSSLLLDGVHDKAKNKIKELYGTEYYVQSDSYQAVIKERNIIKFEDRLSFLGFELVEFYSVNECTIRCCTCKNSMRTTQIKNNKQIICRYCFPININNKTQKLFEEILIDLNIEFEKNNRTVIRPFELDYVIADKKLAFEINGNYYHSELGGGKDSHYHISKTIKAHHAGLRLIHIFEDELKFKRDIVKSRILSVMGKTHKIYGRKCKIKHVPKNEEVSFLNENHIQGYAVSSECLGLYFENNLVALMSFVKNRMVGKKQVELLRFCSKLNHTVIGGFTKLLKSFITNNTIESIITYADLRWSDYDYRKLSYNKNKFNFIGTTKPNYWYVAKSNYMSRYHRLKFRKSELINQGYDKTQTEREIMLSAGYDRIWDCGSHKFELIPTNVSFDQI